MKKLIIPIILIVLCLYIESCSESSPETGSVESIRLRYEGSAIPNNTLTKNLTEGTITFTAEIQVTGSASKDFTLGSSNTAVASVSDKTVTLVSGGQTLITATSSGDSEKKHTITLHVVDNNFYTVTVTSGGSADKSTSLVNQTITLTPGTQAGREFSDWTIEPSGAVMITPNQFIMPPFDVTITGNFREPVTGSAPRYISNNFAGDAASGFVVQWHNDASIAAQTLQVAAASDSFDNAEEIQVTGTLFETSGRVGTHAARNIFKTTVTGLKPATLYKYRMGEPGGWSQVFTHMTSGGSNTEFSFTVLTDPQNATFAEMVIAMNQAESFDNENRFFLICGDITERVESPVEIQNFTNDSNLFNIRKPIASTQGNHDTYYNNSGSEVNLGESTVFNAFIAFPDNGFTETDSTRSKSYYFYYNNVLVIMLNTLVTTEQNNRQMAWLKDLLEHDRENRLSRFRIVATHFGPFGSHYYESYWMRLNRAYYGKIFTDYNIDIVFSGHDHTYSRSNPIKISGTTESTTTLEIISGENAGFHGTPGGVIYSIAGGTGPKFYNAIDGWNAANSTAPYLEALFPANRSTRTTTAISPGTFINVKVRHDTLSVTAMRKNGTMLDQYVVPLKQR